MSAVAFFCTADKIVMHSDGMALQDGKIVSLSHQKIHKITPRVGLLWIGRAGHAAPIVIELFRRAGITDIAGMAEVIGDNIKIAFQLKNQPLPDFTRSRWVVMLVGWQYGQPCMFSLDSKPPNDPFAVRSETLGDGIPGCMTYDKDSTEAPYGPLIRQKYWPLYQDAEHASKLAFKEMVEGYEQAGKPIGGQLYTEVITAPPG